MLNEGHIQSGSSLFTSCRSGSRRFASSPAGRPGVGEDVEALSRHPLQEGHPRSSHDRGGHGHLFHLISFLSFTTLTNIRFLLIKPSLSLNSVHYILFVGLRWLGH